MTESDVALRQRSVRSRRAAAAATTPRQDRGPVDGNFFGDLPRGDYGLGGGSGKRNRKKTYIH